jgi:hypothetical protein
MKNAANSVHIYGSVKTVTDKENEKCSKQKQKKQKQK